MKRVVAVLLCTACGGSTPEPKRVTPDYEDVPEATLDELFADWKEEGPTKIGIIPRDLKKPTGDDYRLTPSQPYYQIAGVSMVFDGADAKRICFLTERPLEPSEMKTPPEEMFADLKKYSGLELHRLVAFDSPSTLTGKLASKADELGGVALDQLEVASDEVKPVDSKDGIVNKRFVFVRMCAARSVVTDSARFIAVVYRGNDNDYGKRSVVKNPPTDPQELASWKDDRAKAARHNTSMKLWALVGPDKKFTFD